MTTGGSKADSLEPPPSGVLVRALVRARKKLGAKLDLVGPPQKWSGGLENQGLSRSGAHGVEMRPGA